MTDSTTSNPTVLLVDDDTALLEVFTAYLEPEYTVRSTTNGHEAVEILKQHPTITAVLLDRAMPQLNGKEVLNKIREQNISCRVAMVTGIDPEMDIIDMEFDAYLTKPVDKSILKQTVAELQDRSEHCEQVHTYSQAITQLETLQSEFTIGELETRPEYRELKQTISELESELDERDLSTHNEFEQALSDIETISPN